MELELGDKYFGREEIVPRILLFITTHVSEQHMQFMERCWPYIIQNTKLVAMSDIFIFSTNTEDLRANEYMLSMLREMFVPVDHDYYLTYKKHRNITLVARDNPGYQRGANLAMKEAAMNDWFNGYEWVVRINPDVLIYNDTWILDIMTQDQNASAIFVNCLDSDRGGSLTHTDFCAFRPEAFPRNLYSSMSDLKLNAEHTATAFFSEFLPNGTDRWLPDTGPHNTQCRVGWKKRWGSPVIHSHGFLDQCPQHSTG